ncbi:MAG: GNAT family N-acetyltransferase [Treponema sp.]|jgi:GNAT superfamily N-acetyltransferase|nr:GNAT family N-acetyltransferase [Treponema sp.]
MSVKFRPYQNITLYGDDYNRVRDFLIELDSSNYHFGRWDWMLTFLKHEWADVDKVEKIGIWEENGKIIAVATFDTRLGSAFLLLLNGYEHLKEEMFLYAKINLAKDGQFRVLILDGDAELQNIAAKNCFFPTQDRELDAVLPINPESIKYTLPDRFKITCLKEDFDLFKDGQCLWRGFDHEMNAEGPFYLDWEKCSEESKKEWDRPNVDFSLKISVVAPNGDYVSHCGMWYDQKSKSALVEPVATEPAYRKMGLGKAAVLEGIKRCGELGATRALVGSSQQFYYSIGFRPYASSTWWKEK